MSRAKAFLKARIAACRTLDEAVYQKFLDEWSAVQPRQWLPDARLILMHKTRVQPDISGLTQEEIHILRGMAKSMLRLANKPVSVLRLPEAH